MPDRKPTTIRFTQDDREVIARLCKLTGLEGTAAVIRLSLRESLAARERPAPPKKRGPRR